MNATQLRPLGKTGAQVEAFSLGGEGVLRTHGREREAVPVILKALELGVRYCDTAPAYASSQSYYGAAFREAGAKARDGVFLATKTHERSRDAALRLLDDSLKRLATDRVDLWQMQTAYGRRSEEMFAKGGHRGGGTAKAKAACGSSASRASRPRHSGRGDGSLRLRHRPRRVEPGDRGGSRSSRQSSPKRASAHGHHRHEGAWRRAHRVGCVASATS